MVKIRDFTPIFDILVEKYGMTTAGIYGRIYRFSFKDGYCRASHATIGNAAGLSRKTVTRHIKKLVDDGYLEDLTPDRTNRAHEYKPTGKVQLEIGVSESPTTGSESPSGGGSESPSFKEDNKESFKEINKEVGNKGDSLTKRDAKSGAHAVSPKNKPKLNPQEQKALNAWLRALVQIKSDMAKATFDQWVSNIDFDHYEDFIFYIRVPDAYQRDWLESRLTSTTARLLVGIMNVPEIKIKFYVRK